MAQPLHSWVQSAQDTRAMGYKNTTGYFLRDPFRRCTITSRYLLSPADGILLYAKEVDADEPVVEVKGKNYTPQQVLWDDKFKQRSLVIGIFMTYYDVHINRCPYNGYLFYEEKPCILTNNLPMVFFEDDLLKGLTSYNSMEYLFANSRMVNTFHCPQLGYKFFLVQIADKEVNVSTHFEMDQGEFINQGDRFSIVRWGSQVDLVLPLDPRFEWQPIIEPMFHVKGGLDKLCELVKK